MDCTCIALSFARPIGSDFEFSVLPKDTSTLDLNRRPFGHWTTHCSTNWSNSRPEKVIGTVTQRDKCVNITFTFTFKVDQSLFSLPDSSRHDPISAVEQNFCFWVSGKHTPKYDSECAACIGHNRPTPCMFSVASSSRHKQGYYRTVSVLWTMSSDKVRTQHCSRRAFLLLFLQYCFVFSYNTIWATNSVRQTERLNIISLYLLHTCWTVQQQPGPSATSCCRLCFVQPLRKGFLVLSQLKVIQVEFGHSLKTGDRVWQGGWAKF